MFSFNLLEKKWLPCIRLNGDLEDLSLREVLTEAADIREIVGDSPPVTIALHRLLLAILHRALNAPQSYDEWNDYWQAKSWNGAKLEKYFADCKPRFDLFDEKRPFYQVGALKDSVQDGAIIQLYLQPKSNATLFDHSTMALPKAISPAEAARLLIAFQGFDIGGIKADGAGGKRSPLMNNAIALIRGENLFETLILNFHQYNEDDEMPFIFNYENDLPAWERERETEVRERKPDGFVDLLTWQSRRILLAPQNSEDGRIIVKNAVIMKGFHFPADYQLYDKETMMAFRKSKTEGFSSIGFSENKALWRDSLSILQTVGAEQYRPKILDWLNELVSENVLTRSSVLPIEFYGLKNDVSNEAKLLFWRQDKFNLPLAYLDNAELLNKLKTALSFSEEIGGKVLRPAIKNLADNLKTQTDNFPAMSVYWSNLEIEFKKLVVALPKQQDKAMCAWFGFVDKTAKNAFNQTANSLSGSALEQKAIASAENLFYGQRKKSLTDEFKIYLQKNETKGGEV